MKTRELATSLHEFSEQEVRRIAKIGGMFMGVFPVSYTIFPGGQIKNAVACLLDAERPGYYEKINLGDWIMKCGDEHYLLRKGVL